MGETPLISVIVPVYNAEHFLKRCVDSIRSQTYKNFEIILIDDGSTDSSGMLCDNYQALDSRIRVIHKPNGGLSSARNAGLDICSGEYIAFVDSDDYIDSKMYESMLSCLEEENVDICVCQWQYELSDGQQVVDISKVNPNIFGKKHSSKFAHFLYQGSYENGVVVAVWNKLYHNCVFASHRFAGRYMEDDNIIGHILSQDYTVFVMDQQYYYYVQNSASLTNQSFGARNIAFLDILERRLNLFSSDPYMVDNTARLYCNIYIEYYFKAKKINASLPSIQTFDEMFRQLRANRSCTLKFYIRMHLFRFFPAAYDFLLNR